MVIQLALQLARIIQALVTSDRGGRHVCTRQPTLRLEPSPWYWALSGSFGAVLAPNRLVYLLEHRQDELVPSLRYMVCFSEIVEALMHGVPWHAPVVAE